jgi:hypothetical protein
VTSAIPAARFAFALAMVVTHWATHSSQIATLVNWL